jgi:hypothetical protein
MAFYGNVFDTDVYAPRFELEDKYNNMYQWELHKHGFMNAHAKSTQKEVFVYPASWKETQDKIFPTPNNDFDTDTDIDNDIDNDIDLYTYKDEEKKPQSLFITADMILFQYPVFRAPVSTIITSTDRPTMPRMFQPSNAKEKLFFLKTVLEEAGIDTTSAQKRTWYEVEFDSDSTSEADFFKSRSIYILHFILK